MADKRQRWHWFKFQCQQCGTDSTATRKDARFCGVNCRTYWHKAHKLTEAPKPSRRAPVAPPPREPGPISRGTRQDTEEGRLISASHKTHYVVWRDFGAQLQWSSRGRHGYARGYGTPMRGTGCRGVRPAISGRVAVQSRLVTDRSHIAPECRCPCVESGRTP